MAFVLDAVGDTEALWTENALYGKSALWSLSWTLYQQIYRDRGTGNPLSDSGEEAAKPTGPGSDMESGGLPHMDHTAQCRKRSYLHLHGLFPVK